MSHFRKYFQLGVSFLILGGGGGYLYPKIKDALKFQEQSQTPPQETQGNLNVAMEVNFYLKNDQQPRQCKREEVWCLSTSFAIRPRQST